ncbi:hypothetical protein M3612_25340 [Niallia taxi]|uniref:hypothetical protein n=1 Tax=Niallia taxi TaxID=2499688 RepID=UPI002042313B|nr:hypothetical protein [Niallia taxi]MCM3217799.1 hypothetical protein [Niallia taxi]
MSIDSPNERYDKSVGLIDEKICELINKRKLISHNPGYPTADFITDWSKKYNLYEEFLDSLFSHILNEEMYKPIEKPKGFIKNLPVLKSYEIKDIFYSVTLVRQYKNVSVVHLNIDRDSTEEKPGDRHPFTFIELTVEDNGNEYDCRYEGGAGSDGHMSFDYIVSPPLPNDMSQIKFIFNEYNEPFRRKPTGLEFVITLDK